ncbi:16S rRNA (guanine(966)-N(2))-methyltransferase RsmD [Xylella taiwanensis]|uniref:Ribosomal RNA small subunit methyltransferase D n=1 Tax=Xylella taiwanensis TaxID=1444770 RepID=Z9JLD9_9GAMM|nr:16S rRNA (guanine(966)-N(2))-methyltransferase RsmD [Xylella taiwanensis]AXI82748.1 methyltransferase [Xylella taiwanensis]EWS78557.1 methyltransferase [Xylella taiwanensis]MCD8455755.1 16S rRNA (guanine(966)-N(2))-methyltransferase RsmD [Xylella taiwanensis]MCD8458160.1 16S rRNA (guanine(966)-N(2))-methyltransferase RsmD [Xylella taiwanensis]MCD8460296.1 16S rRNA (guanine(966)-N(2))-methyltransferase RsmD [Xylella taiwanensis]
MNHGRVLPVRVSGAGQVRIIGGRWRNTRLVVPDLPGLRPTSSRVRETLFNWLMPVLPGAHVLDLFAGSGALGLEAVSRGAAAAVLIERHPGLVARLREQVTRLGAQHQVEIVQADVLQWLQRPGAVRFDIAFVDPPFTAGLWETVTVRLAGHLAAAAWVYLESPADLGPVMLSAGWEPYRDGHTREVRYALYRYPAVTLRADLNSVSSI